MKKQYQPFFEDDFSRKLSNPHYQENMIVTNKFREYERDYTKVQSGIQNIKYQKMVQSSNGPEYDKKIHGILFDHKGRLK